MILITENQLIELEFARRAYRMVAPASVALEDLLRAEPWANVAERRVRTGDHVEVLAEDGSWWAELLVRHCAGSNIVLGILHKRLFEDIGVASALFSVAWKGPTAKWCVVRKSDGKVMAQGLYPREAAETWLKDNLEPVQAAA